MGVCVQKKNNNKFFLHTKRKNQKEVKFSYEPQRSRILIFDYKPEVCGNRSTGVDFNRSLPFIGAAAEQESIFLNETGSGVPNKVVTSHIKFFKSKTEVY